MTPLKVTPLVCENCGQSSATQESVMLVTSFLCLKCSHVTQLKRSVPKKKQKHDDKKNTSKNKNEGESE